MDIDLTKKAEKIGIILTKKGLKQAPTMRVGIAYDVSGSMSQFSPNVRQQAFNQMMGVAVKFDDNGELDVFKFDSHCEYVGTSKPVKGDYDTYLADNGIVPSGGTRYKPIVDEALEFFFNDSGTPARAAEPAKKGIFGFGGKPAVAAVPEVPVGTVDDTPVLMLIITDGEPGDADAAMQAMRAAAKHAIYFHMVGIGGERRDFPTIAKMADALDNVGEVYLPRVDMSDDEIYDQLICDELISFLASHAPLVFGRGRG